MKKCFYRKYTLEAIFWPLFNSSKLLKTANPSKKLFCSKMFCKEIVRNDFFC